MRIASYEKKARENKSDFLLQIIHMIINSAHVTGAIFFATILFNSFSFLDYISHTYNTITQREIPSSVQARGDTNKRPVINYHSGWCIYHRVVIVLHHGVWIYGRFVSRAGL